MNSKLRDWPAEGHVKWLAIWENMIYQADQQLKYFDDLLEEISMVSIARSQSFFSHSQTQNTKKMANYIYVSISAEI